MDLTAQTLPAVFASLIVLTTAGCGDQPSPPLPDPIAPDSEVRFILQWSEFGTYTLTPEQGQCIIALVNSKPTIIVPQEKMEYVTSVPPGIFWIGNRKYEYEGSLFYHDSEGNEFIWKHPFLDALWLPPGLDDLPTFFDTMKNYEWPDTPQ